MKFLYEGKMYPFTEEDWRSWPARALPFGLSVLLSDGTQVFVEYEPGEPYDRAEALTRVSAQVPHAAADIAKILKAPGAPGYAQGHEYMVVPWPKTWTSPPVLASVFYEKWHGAKALVLEKRVERADRKKYLQLLFSEHIDTLLAELVRTSRREGSFAFVLRSDTLYVPVPPRACQAHLLTHEVWDGETGIKHVINLYWSTPASAISPTISWTKVTEKLSPLEVMVVLVREIAPKTTWWIQ